MNKTISVLILLVVGSCSTPIEKVRSINSRVNFNNFLNVENKSLKNNGFDKSQFIDSVKRVLIQNKTINIPYRYRNYVEDITFKDFNDTIFIADLNLKTLSGGIPLEFEYDVKPNDIIYFDVTNTSRNKLDRFEITEGKVSRFLIEDMRKKDVVSSSFKVLSDKKIKFSLLNDNLINNFGLFKSKIKLSVSKTTNVFIKSQIIYDSSFVVEKKIIKNINDTIFNVETNDKYKIGSKLNLKLPNEIILPIKINKGKDILSWTYWIGLKVKDSINIEEVDNPIFNFTLDELKNQVKNRHSINYLKSINDEIELFFENYTLDRRSLNFDKNYALYRVDNSFTNNVSDKGKIVVRNKSNLYDYDMQFVLVSTSITKTKIETLEQFIEPKKYVKLELIGL